MSMALTGFPDWGDRTDHCIHLYVSRAYLLRDPWSPDRHFHGVDDLFGRQARIQIFCWGLRWNIISYRLGTNGWVLIPVGLVYFLIYLFPFQLCSSEVLPGSAWPASALPGALEPEMSRSLAGPQPPGVGLLGWGGWFW